MNIPEFVKKLGYEIIAYILNVSNSDAIRVFNNSFDFSENQINVLKSYINSLKKIKEQTDEIEGGSIQIISFVSGLIYKNREHLFNKFRKVNGGGIPITNTGDIIERLVFNLTIEAYPVFLLKIEDRFSNGIGLSSHVSSLFYSLPNGKELRAEIIKDKSLKRLFSLGINEMDTCINFSTSSGLSSNIQLIGFPDIIVSKVYELMVLERDVSINNLSKYTKEVVSMYRELGNTNKVQVPIFIGFENVAIPNDIDMKDGYSSIKGYDKVFYDKLPQYIKPSLLNEADTHLGFVLESKFNYEIELNVNLDDNYKFPDRFKNNFDEINRIKNNLALSFTLANENKLVGVNPKFTIVFSLLSYGTSLSWYDNHPNSNSTKYSKEDFESVSKWYEIINKSDDSKIQLAIRRILSAVNNRIDPVDGFIDSIIALENMFGHGSGEIGFKLSMAVAFLLKTKSEERKNLQKQVNGLYGKRSKVLHGAENLSYNDAKKNRDESLKIAIGCIKALYNNSDLLTDKSRGKTILLS